MSQLRRNVGWQETLQTVVVKIGPNQAKYVVFLMLFSWRKRCISTVIFVDSHFCVAVLPLLPSLSPSFIPHFPLSLSLRCTSPPVVQRWVREGGGSSGSWCLGMEQEEAWRPVCPGALNESMIHGTSGSHRDRIRGALSKHSPETGKRDLICPPHQQLTLLSACVCVFVCFLFYAGFLLHVTAEINCVYDVVSNSWLSAPDVAFVIIRVENLAFTVSNILRD